MIGGIYGWIAGAVLILASLGGAYFQGRQDGENIARSEYAARDIKAASEAQAAYKDITDRYRAKEQASAQKINVLATQYEKRLAANETARITAIATAPILRDPGNRVETCNSGTGETSTTTSKRDGGTGANLSKEASGFLYNLAAEADLITLQLQACQQVLLQDRQ
jgi:hypothetical protein